jgi:membrane-bound lytic murein transglycosylase A
MGGMTIRLALVAAALLLVACTAEKPPPAVPAGLHLSRANFDQLPGWQESDAQGALASFQRGCAILMQNPDATPMGGAGYGGTVGDWRGACAAASGDAKIFFAQNFTPYAVSGDALFTGYYEPQIRGSRARGGAFQTPVYGLPSDLVRADLGLFDPKLKGEHVSGRVLGHTLVPATIRSPSSFCRFRVRAGWCLTMAVPNASPMPARTAIPTRPSAAL